MQALISDFLEKINLIKHGGNWELRNQQPPPVQNAPPPHHVVNLQGENLQANAQPAEVIIDERRVRNIQKMKPPTFEGGLNVTQAENWLTEME